MILQTSLSRDEPQNLLVMPSGDVKKQFIIEVRDDIFLHFKAERNFSNSVIVNEDPNPIAMNVTLTVFLVRIEVKYQL